MLIQKKIGWLWNSDSLTQLHLISNTEKHTLILYIQSAGRDNLALCFIESWPGYFP